MRYNCESRVTLYYGRKDWVSINYTLDRFDDEPYDITVYDENNNDVTGLAMDMTTGDVITAVMTHIHATNAQRGRDLAKAAKENAQ